MTNHRNETYVGRHRAEQPETTPQKIIRYVHDHLVGEPRQDDDTHLFTHPTQLHPKGTQK